MEVVAREKERVAALQAFIARRADNKGRKPIDDTKLPAGSPMHFTCVPCNGVIEVEEDYTPPRPKYCPNCRLLEQKGWLEEFLRHVQKNR